MKIIEENDRYVEKTWRVQCTGLGWNQGNLIPCGSILEVDIYDLERYTGQDYPIRRDPTVLFTCMKCGRRSDLPADHEITKDHLFDSRIQVR